MGSTPNNVFMTASGTLIIRRADARDRAAVKRLAALDSSRIPAGELLLAEVDGVLRAALAVASREYIADPFVSTRELVALLDRRAAKLRQDTVPLTTRARDRLALWNALWLRASEAGRVR